MHTFQKWTSSLDGPIWYWVRKGNIKEWKTPRLHSNCGKRQYQLHVLSKHDCGPGRWQSCTMFQRSNSSVQERVQLGCWWGDDTIYVFRKKTMLVLTQMCVAWQSGDHTFLFNPTCSRKSERKPSTHQYSYLSARISQWERAALGPWTTSGLIATALITL